MTTPVENFINNELPKRPYTDDASNAWDVAGKVLVTTGTALGVTQGSLSTSDLATVTYVDGLILGLWDDRGAYTVNADGNINYPSSAGSGVEGALMKGDIFTVAGAVAGVSKINNIAVNNGDTVRALVDNPSATDNAHWTIAENNIGYVPENRANKTTDTDLSGATGTYPDTPTVKSYIDNHDISAASISSTGTVTLTRTTSDLTFQVPTAISGLSFDPNTGVLTSSYTNDATSTTITVAANEVADNVFRIKDNDDATKKIAFQASGITAGETRTITMPNANVDLGKVPTNLAYDSATAVLTQTLTDATSLSADLSAIAVNQVALTGGSMTTTVTVTDTQASTKYFLAGNTSLLLTFDVTAFTNTGKFIEIVNNTGGYRTITIVATGRNFRDETNDLVISPVTLVRGESLVVFPVNATTLQVYRNKPDVRNIKNNSNTITSGFKTTNLFVDSSTTVGGISANGDEILRIFALSSATINFGANVYDARTNTQISTGSYTLYAGQVLEVTKTDVSKWVILGGHIQDTSRFRLYNSSNVPTKFDTSAATAECTITMPNANVDLGTMSSVATTDSNNLSGTRTRIVGGSGNNVSGTDNIAIGGSGNNAAGARAVLINCSAVAASSINDFVALNARGPNTSNLDANSIILGTSKQTNLFKGIGTAASLRLNALYALSSDIPISGTLYATTDGSQTLSDSNLVLGVNDTGACATHEVEFIVCAGVANGFGGVLPTGYFIAKRRIAVFRHAPSGTFYVSAVQTIGTDITLGTLGGTITPDLNIDTTTGSATIHSLRCKIDRTGGVAGQEVVAMSVRVASHHSK